MSCTNPEQLSFAKRLFIGLCATLFLGAGLAACGGSNNQCDKGEKLFNYRGDEAKCYKTCEVSSDCPNNQKCVQGKLCDPQTGDNGDTSGDTSQDDTYMADSSDTGTDDTGGGDVCTTPGTKTCKEVSDCSLKCTDRSCLNNCISQGTCTAQDRFNAYTNCIRSKCGDGSSATCRFNKCDSQIRKCNLYGSAKCHETEICTTKCIIKVQEEAPQGASDQRIRELYAQCLAQCPDGTKEAQKQAAKISACEESSGCRTQDPPPACSVKNCKSQQQKCGLLQGTAQSCRDLQLCFAGCGTSGYTCTAKCYERKASAQARIDQADLGACQSTCEDNNPNDLKARLNCVYSNCKTQLESCGNLRAGAASCSSDSDCPASTMTCSNGKCMNTTCDATLECLVNNQRSDPKLATKCRLDSTATARKKLSRYIQCIQDNGGFRQCSPGSSCTQNNCPKLDNACNWMSN